MFKQLSVYLRNTPGELSKFCSLLIEHDIEIRAITVAESEKYGLILLLVDKPDDCIDLLDKEQYSVSLTMVLAVKIDSENNTKGLREISKLLGDNNVNIDYLYSTLVKDESLIILKVDDNKKAQEVLEKSGFIFENRHSV
ncbi:MAG: acetolactate synthase [Candidatus Lokiarchaeota archaeon]|nr:acetolactate synthase [Candidatus Lokiarchaeota archaeon]MBD3342788.1 acetolactate synthase [Candidatus Lokiarchaeota archaeon]